MTMPIPHIKRNLNSVVGEFYLFKIVTPIKAKIIPSQFVWILSLVMVNSWHKLINFILKLILEMGRDTVNSRLPRSSSIDSMVEAVWAESVETGTEPIITTPEKRPSLRNERPLALVSPSVGRRMKGQRGINGEWSPKKPKGQTNDLKIVTSLLATI